MTFAKVGVNFRTGNKFSIKIFVKTDFETGSFKASVTKAMRIPISIPNSILDDRKQLEYIKFGKSKGRYINPLHLGVFHFAENCHIFSLKVFIVLLIVLSKTSQL